MCNGSQNVGSRLMDWFFHHTATTVARGLWRPSLANATGRKTTRATGRQLFFHGCCWCSRLFGASSSSRNGVTISLLKATTSRFAGRGLSFQGSTSRNKSWWRWKQFIATIVNDTTTVSCRCSHIQVRGLSSSKIDTHAIVNALHHIVVVDAATAVAVSLSAGRQRSGSLNGWVLGLLRTVGCCGNITDAGTAARRRKGHHLVIAILRLKSGRKIHGGLHDECRWSIRVQNNLAGAVGQWSLHLRR
mmetsp:Transcript_2787/g.7807  ORF Transcript_2787/g.7807 Transcript_2787/m.7807 type:complete len:246 (+) Transcript_2787:1346-2083(+)